METQIQIHTYHSGKPEAPFRKTKRYVFKEESVDYVKLTESKKRGDSISDSSNTPEPKKKKIVTFSADIESKLQTLKDEWDKHSESVLEKRLDAFDNSIKEISQLSYDASDSWPPIDLLNRITEITRIHPYKIRNKMYSHCLGPQDEVSIPAKRKHEKEKLKELIKQKLSKNIESNQKLSVKDLWDNQIKSLICSVYELTIYKMPSQHNDINQIQNDLIEEINNFFATPEMDVKKIKSMIRREHDKFGPKKIKPTSQK